jgi:hypothetical protein
MKRILGVLLAVLSTQGLFANARGCYDNSSCATDSCWDFCNADFYAYVDWLYWKARRCDLDIATFDGVGILTPAATTVAVPGKVICLEHKYHSGVRVGAGMEWCSGWGFGLEYVYFNPTDKTRAAAPNGASIMDLTRIPGLLLLNNPTAVAAEYRLKLNQVDLLFTYKHGCNPSRKIRSFFGTRLAWIDDGFDNVYTGNLIGTTPGPAFTANILEATKLNAYGLLAGGQVFQDLWCSFGLYMKASLGVLYGSYDQHSEVRFSSTGNALVPGYNVNDDCSCLLSTIDLAVGLGFQGCSFCNATWNFVVGYEFHNWFSYRDYLRPLTDIGRTTNVFIRNKSDLGFDGLFVRLGVEF